MNNVIPFDVAKQRQRAYQETVRWLDTADACATFEAQMEKFRLARRARVDAKVDRERGLEWQRDNPAAAKNLKTRLYTQATRKARRALLKAWRLRRPPRPVKQGMRCSTGLGKTQAAIQALIERYRTGRDLQPVDWTASTHVKALEVEAALKAGGVPVIVLQGRGRVDDNDQIPEAMLVESDDPGKMCPRHEQASIVSEAGESVQEKLCRVCPLAGICGWKRQIRQAEEIMAAGGVVITMTAHKYCQMPIKRPAIAIIDEDFVASASRRVSIPQRDMAPEAVIGAMGAFGAANGEEVYRLVSNLGLLLMLKDEIDAIARAREAIPEMMRLAELLRTAKELAKGDLKVGRETPLDELRQNLGKSRVRVLGRMIVLVAQMINMAEREVRMHSIVVKPSGLNARGDEREDGGDVEVAYVIKPRIKKGANVLLLDATLRQTRAAALLGLREEQLPVTVIEVAHNLRVHHIKCTGSKIKLLASHKPNDPAAQEDADSYFRSLVDAAKAQSRGTKILWCGNKDVEAKVKEIEGEDASTTHYFATRGVNEWADHDAVVCIGQAMPGLFELEQQAAGIAAFEGRSITTVRQWLKEHPDAEQLPSRFIKDPDGNPWHPDPFVRELIESIADNEIVQTAGRLRALLSKEPKDLVIIGQRVPELFREAVQSTMALKRDSIAVWIQRELKAKGFLALSPARAQAEHPDLWTSPRSAQEAFRNASAEERFRFSPATMGQTLSCKSYDEAVWPISKLPEGGWRYLVRVQGSNRDIKVSSPTPLQPAGVMCLGEILKFEDVSLYPRELHPSTLIAGQGAGKEPATKAFHLSPSGAVVKKTFALDKQPLFNFKEIPVKGIDELATALEGLAADPTAFVIRGQARPGIDIKKPQRRALKPKRLKNGKILPATFEDTPRSWCLLDVDNYRMPLGLEFLDNPGYAAQLIHRQLPEPFCSTTCYARASSSAGMGKDPTEVKMHMWFWLAEPLTSAQLKVALKALDSNVPLDLRLANPIQIHYTADPIFQGVEDPLATRGWVIHGEHEAADLAPPDPETMQTSLPRGEIDDLDRIAAPRLFQGSLKYIGDQGAGGRGFQSGILTSAKWAALSILEGKLTMPVAVQLIQEAVLKADPGSRPPEEIDRYAGGYFVESKVDWWLSQLARKVPA